MKNIIVVASELSIITGHNTFEKPEKAIDAVLNRSGIVKKHIPKSKIEESLLSLKEVDVAVIKKELNLPDNTSLKEVENIINKQVMGKSFDSSLSENQSKEKVDEILKAMPTLNKCLEGSVKQDLRMTRGNIKEDNNLDKTEKKCNIQITSRNSQMYEKLLYTDPNGKFQVILRGKVDGMNDEYVVETKNRARRLFGKIPEYEKVQLNAYMFMTGKDKALHIECYNEYKNQTEYGFDKVFWDGCLDKVIQFSHEHIESHLK